MGKISVASVAYSIYILTVQDMAYGASKHMLVTSWGGVTVVEIL